MKEYLIDFLECPNCHGKLLWEIIHKCKDEIDDAKATCESCFKTYPIQEGIALFLIQGLSKTDPWETTESNLLKMFKQYPMIEYELLNTQVEMLSPTDLFLKALLLEETDDLLESQSLFEIAQDKLYTKETIFSMHTQLDYVVNNIKNKNEPIIDLASGRCVFAKKLALRTDNQIIITDISPRILRRTKKYFETFSDYGKISLIAMDAHSTPFKSRSIRIMTTFLGLPNIENPEGLLNEIRRVISGTFFAIHTFYPDDKSNNASTIRNANMDTFCFKKLALDNFLLAGWDVSVQNSISTFEKPAEPGRIIQGARINTIPSSEVISEWCTLVCI